MSCFIFLVYCSKNKCTFVSNNFASLINEYYPVKYRNFLSFYYCQYSPGSTLKLIVVDMQELGKR